MVKTQKKVIFVKGKNVSTFQIAATYIGTVVGAGFASGQEILQFFGNYGLKGFSGIFVATVLFILYGYIILKLGLKLKVSSYRQIIQYSTGKWAGIVIDIIVTVFLFSALSAMIAGTGAIFYEQFSLPHIYGNIFMTVISLITAIMGIKGIITAISLVVPFLLAGIFLIFLLTVYRNITLNINIIQQVNMAFDASGRHWLLSALIYVSFNMIIAVAVLGPLGAELNKYKEAKKGSIMGGIGLGMAALAILITLFFNMPGVFNYEIPMIYVAGKFSIIFQILYCLILLVEIYTTAVGNLFGFASRLTENKGSKYKMVVIISSVLALIASQLGFSRIVYYIYPLVGYAGLLLMLCLTISYMKNKSFKIQL